MVTILKNRVSKIKKFKYEKANIARIIICYRWIVLKSRLNSPNEYEKEIRQARY